MRLSLRPALASLKLVTAIPSQILLEIPQTRFRLSESQEWPPIDSSLYHEGSNLRLETQEIRIQAIASRTEVVVRHMFIGENDDECHESSHSSG